MTDLAIEISDLGKKYCIRRSNASSGEYLTLRESITEKFQQILKRKHQKKKKDFWALKHIDLTIAKGEKIGIIGQNGAGKSTLLKILSRITAPTCGKVTINGQVSSLLEVGTGFHPELTGRENIFLNASILGMSRGETRRKLDEIIDFSGIEDFIHTPVKRYSSGMRSRLGFSIAAHMRSDIMLLDEILSVGDSEFQRKCYQLMSNSNFMGDRTVLFVSHNLAGVKSFCDRSILIEQGALVFDGNTQDCLNHYLNRNIPPGKQRFFESEWADIIGVWLEDDEGHPIPELLYGQNINLCIKIRAKKDLSHMGFHLGFNKECNRIFTSDSKEFGFKTDLKANKVMVLKVSYDQIHFMPGLVHVSKFSIRNKLGRDVHIFENIFSFEISYEPYKEKSLAMTRTGIIIGKSQWKVCVDAEA